MKRTLAILTAALCAVFLAAAQDSGLNASAENITGTYYVSHEGENSKVRIFRETDGTFTAQVTWVENSLDGNGNIRLDEKNPGKKRWDNGKIYDPTRGIRANATCSFDSPSILRVRGSLMGFGETVFWEKTGK